MKTSTEPNRTFYQIGPGILAGVTAGYFMVMLESFFLLITIGTLVVDPFRFLTAMLIYTLGGAVAGAASAWILSLSSARIRHFNKDRSFAFFFSSWFGIGLCLELTVYAMDIIPLGGANKFSGRTLAVLATGTVLCLVLALTINHFLNRINRNSTPGKHRSTARPILLPATVVLLLFIGLIVLFNTRPGRTLAFENTDGQSPPNVFIILVDALRPDHLSCYGHTLPTSPHIDRLAQEGLWCRSAFSVSNWSIPTHGSLFSGLYAGGHGAYSQFSILDEEVLTLAEILSEQGYHTANITNNPLVGRSGGLSQGFELVLGIENENKASYTLPRLFEKMITTDSLTDDILRLSEKIIHRSRQRQTPYFLFVNLLDVHSPYIAKEPYFSRFTSSLDLTKVNLHLVNRFRESHIPKKEQFALIAKFTENDLEYLRRMYDSNIRYVDNQIGILLRNLERKGELGNTLIIVTADHGEYLGEHGGIGHITHDLYNQGLKIPLIFWYPEKLPPRVIDENVSQVDVLPTVLTILGRVQHIPHGVHGRNLLEPLPDRYVLAEFFDDHLKRFSRTILRDGYKLIVKVDGTREFYNFAGDPLEKNDLIDEETMQALIAEFGFQLENQTKSMKKHRIRLDQEKHKNRVRKLKSMGYLTP